MSSIDRRNFLKASLAAATAAATAGCATTTGRGVIGGSPLTGQKSVMGLVVPPMETVRVGFIGVGQRGVGAVKHFCNIDGVEIRGICDIDQQVLDRAVNIVTARGMPRPAAYGKNAYAYRDLLERDDIDMVIISTPWRWHTPMAVETMLAGKHAMVEVPAALTIDEAWLLVDTAEQTQKNCMMLENVCYGRDELMALNMVRKGLLGDLLHGEAAYIHELRWQMKEVDRKTGSWRTRWHALRDANLYPTHGLGPIAQYMNINRGDRFDYMNSMSSPALGRAAYAEREFPADHQRNRLNYIAGDINTSLIKTVKGRTIMVQHDTTTPRPYSRHNHIQGANGVFAGFPNRIALEKGGRKSFHEWDYDMDYWYERYDHPLWRRMGEVAERNGGHGGMDFLMFWRLVYCLRNGLPLDQDVYDAAAWSAVTPLSEASVKNRGDSVDFPDFTRGAWKTAIPLGVVS
ncbi:Gfo/Idh/MocA family protein [Microbulbifer spongiae]|uniref:Gfo/Idh/MocA family oxidoreductase n=1 Tax=Microbulbifer spongiae TaxID=2944933 RepID=A0ABY9EES6_9GAMM|nr:Gfo/Idh/MocA family oxidoreductase [Microbulbifer sp. MI-G]WKD50891.1 Gfo/Idh/MocA family oxidoreductase [Microbulbifer sp. MI-G]